MVPKLPGWNGLHPLIIHFPIALLMVAPLFVLLAVTFKKHARAFAISALILMLLATLSLYVAVSTGRAAADLVEATPQISLVLERHEGLGAQTRLIFTALTLTYLNLLVIPWVLKKELRRSVALALNGVFLLLYLAGTLRMVQTAHLGATLVHGLGVHALMDSPPAGQSLDK